MGFVVIFVVACLVILVFYSMNKSLSVLENSFIFLTVMIIGINISWVVIEELKRIELTKEGWLYAAFFLYRSMVKPIIVLIMFNVIYKVKTTSITLLSMGITMVIILALNGVLRFYDIWSYTRWNVFYDILQILFIQLLAFALLTLYRRTTHREVKAS